MSSVLEDAQSGARPSDRKMNPLVRDSAHRCAEAPSSSEPDIHHAAFNADTNRCWVGANSENTWPTRRKTCLVLKPFHSEVASTHGPVCASRHRHILIRAIEGHASAVCCTTNVHKCKRCDSNYCNNDGKTTFHRRQCNSVTPQSRRKRSEKSLRSGRLLNAQAGDRASNHQLLNL